MDEKTSPECNLYAEALVEKLLKMYATGTVHTPVHAGGGGLLGSCVAWRKRNKAGLKLGALLNTVQGSLLPTYHAHTQTHTHTHSGLRNGPTYMALALWLSPPCKWSGVEWVCDWTGPAADGRQFDRWKERLTGPCKAEGPVTG